MAQAVGGFVDTRRSGIGPGVVGLLAVAMFINYVDRGNLATAAPLIKDQLGLTNVQAGLLLSAFFWTYTPFQLVAGWLADRINPYRTLALGLGLWSLATIGCGLVGGFAALFALRLLLGIGESATFPCNAKLLAGLPASKLGTPNGLIGTGMALGPALGTFAGGLLMAHIGWRAVFVLFGLVSTAWLIPWALVTRRASAGVAAVISAMPVPSYNAILRRREAWGASLGHFAHNYGFYFVITWLPLYLVKARGFSVSEMAELGGILYLVYAVSMQLTGIVSDRWMRAGASGTLVRKTFCVAAHLGITACMILCAVGGPTLSVVALLLSGLFFGFNSATIFAVGQILGGPGAAGKWMGVQNCLGNLAGIIAPIVTGYVVDRTGQFSLAFAIAAAISVAGIIGWGLIIRRIEPLDWA